jgi:hypothetical protein
LSQNCGICALCGTYTPSINRFNLSWLCLLIVSELLFLSLKLRIYGKTCVELTPNKHVQINPNEFGDRATFGSVCPSIAGEPKKLLSS